MTADDERSGNAGGPTGNGNDDGDGDTDQGVQEHGQGLDPVTLEVLRNRLEGIAEEMGQVLVRGAYSPNITERRDCSTALFDADGRMVAQAEHIPVHLGAMPEAVAEILDRAPEPGDVWALNDPFAGGTHLPDVTLVSPVAPDGDIIGYAVSRAHHADVGGSTPGSMPAGAREIYEEGVRLPGVRLVQDGEIRSDVLEFFLANVRTRAERRADLRAQLAAHERGAERIGELLAERGRDAIEDAFDAVQAYSRDRVESELAAIPDGEYTARDVVEGDGVTEDDVEIAVTVTIDGETMTVDFAGSADQVAGNVNAPRAVATAAVYFVLRSVTDPDVPSNAGCYEPVTIETPQGSVVDPVAPAAVVGGNVETSQRLTDVLFAALADAVPERVPAGGQGTMNNLVVGSRTDAFTYYETIGGGAGATAGGDGLDGVQVGMTNTRNTPVEVLEAEYPLRVDRYAFRPDTGGDGEYRGGLGLERALTVTVPASVSLLTDRRRTHPRGIAGGEDGATGENLIDGEPVPGKTTVDVPAGTTIVVRTPGGGGHGDPTDRDPAARARDASLGKTTTDPASEPNDIEPDDHEPDDENDDEPDGGENDDEHDGGENDDEHDGGENDDEHDGGENDDELDGGENDDGESDS